MNKEFKLSQTHPETRSMSYFGTCPASPEGKEFLRCLRVLYRSRGIDVYVGNRNENRRQFRGTPFMNSRGGVCEVAASRHDIYGRDNYGSFPKWYLMTLGELQEKVASVERLVKTELGIDFSTLTGNNRWSILRLLSTAK